MKPLVAGLALAALTLGAGSALARNFHVAGGIQYVIQGNAEKNKGNLDDARRIFGKAVRELTTGTRESPNDNEAWSYLGWAYAELDSAEQAGRAFDAAVEKLKADPKALDRAVKNREHYWVGYFNAGILSLQNADKILPLADIARSTDAEKAGRARAELDSAVTFLKKAMAILPSKPDSYGNLALAYVALGKTEQALATLDAGLAIAPNDEKLLERKSNLTGGAASQLMADKKYDEAIALFARRLDKDAHDFDAANMIAEAYTEKAAELEGQKDSTGARAARAKSAEAFGRAAAIAPSDSVRRILTYNQAVASESAGQPRQAAELCFGLIQSQPNDLDAHRVLRTAYDSMGLSEQATDEFWVIAGLSSKATSEANPDTYLEALPKASDAAKVVAAQGKPDEVRHVVAGDTKVDIWFYWAKKRAFAFTTNRQMGSANFGVLATGAPAVPGAGTKPTPKAPARKPAAPQPGPGKTPTGGKKG